MAAAAALIALGAAGATALMQRFLTVSAFAAASGAVHRDCHNESASGRLLNGGKEQEEDTKEEAADDDDAEPENGTLERIMLDALQASSHLHSAECQ